MECGHNVAVVGLNPKMRFIRYHPPTHQSLVASIQKFNEWSEIWKTETKVLLSKAVTGNDAHYTPLDRLWKILTSIVFFARWPHHCVLAAVNNTVEYSSIVACCRLLHKALLSLLLATFFVGWVISRRARYNSPPPSVNRCCVFLWRLRSVSNICKACVNILDTERSIGNNNNHQQHKKQDYVDGFLVRIWFIVRIESFRFTIRTSTVGFCSFPATAVMLCFG